MGNAVRSDEPELPVHGAAAAGHQPEPVGGEDVYAESQSEHGDFVVGDESAGAEFPGLERDE